MFTEISQVQFEALHHHNAQANKTRFRKSGVSALNSATANGIDNNSKIMLASILHILGANIYVVKPEESVEDPVEVTLYFESTYDVFWKIVNEFLALAKLEVDKTPPSTADKIPARDSYIDFIRTPSSESESKIVILVALINKFSETKIEQDKPFSKKSMYIHKRLDVLLSSIVLFDKNKC